MVCQTSIERPAADRAPLLAQRVDPCPRRPALIIAIEPPRDHPEAGIPTHATCFAARRPDRRAVSGWRRPSRSRYVAQLRYGGHRASPGHPGVAGRARGSLSRLLVSTSRQPRCTSILDTTATTRIGVLRGGEIVQQRTQSVRCQRGCRGNNEHHRHRPSPGSRSAVSTNLRAAAFRPVRAHTMKATDGPPAPPRGG